MIKIREFLECERLQMFKLRNEGKTYEFIANLFNCSDACVIKVIRKINNYGTARNLHRSGRKRCTDQRADQRIV